MKTMKPFVSVDIETTHLDPEKGQLLEIGAIYVPDELSSPEHCKSFKCLIKYDEYKGSPIALSMNSDLLKKLASVQPTTLLSEGFSYIVTDTIEEAMYCFDTWLGGLNLGNIVFAGKNISGFDLPWLRKNKFATKISHRTIDVGSVYWSRFGYNPSIDEICQLLGLPAVKHRALDDALTVAHALQAAYKAVENTD